MTTMWWEGPMVGLDYETTSPDPFEARIVSAAIVSVGTPEGLQTSSLRLDPGVEIPEEATAVHGITTEEARATGKPAAEGVEEILWILDQLLAADPGCPLVVFNARYDLTVTAAEARRHGLDLSMMLQGAHVVCPATIDKFLDKYRRSYPTAPRGMTNEQAKEQGYVSTRTLEGMCGVYGATLDGAHDAAFDALAGVRLAYRMGQRGEVKRRVRHRGDAVELAGLKRQWEKVRHDLPALHDWQQAFALEERERFAEYKRSIGENDEALRIEAERGWPFLELPEVVA